MSLLDALPGVRTVSIDITFLVRQALAADSALAPPPPAPSPAPSPSPAEARVRA